MNNLKLTICAFGLLVVIIVLAITVIGALRTKTICYINYSFQMLNYGTYWVCWAIYHKDDDQFEGIMINIKGDSYGEAVRAVKDHIKEMSFENFMQGTAADIEWESSWSYKLQPWKQ